jgi:hypothetical protein
MFVLKLLEQINAAGQIMCGDTGGLTIHSLHGLGDTMSFSSYLGFFFRLELFLLKEQRTAVKKQIGKFVLISKFFYLKRFSGQSAQLFAFSAAGLDLAPDIIRIKKREFSSIG